MTRQSAGSHAEQEQRCHDGHGSADIVRRRRTELPRPRRGARWRWSRPQQALVTGGALAAVLSLDLATGASAGAALGHPPEGAMTERTVFGRINALSDDDITVETSAKTSVAVAYSSSTTFKSNDDSATATSVTIGRPLPMGERGAGGAGTGGNPPSGSPMGA
jgi:hypothetical protein